MLTKRSVALSLALYLATAAFLAYKRLTRPRPEETPESLRK